MFAETEWNGRVDADEASEPLLRSGRSVPLVSIRQLMEAEAPEYLIEGILPFAAFIGLIAPPKQLKTFLALDWAFCIASGRKWNGHLTRRGIVVYIAAEGGRAGLKRRIKAWCKHHNVEEMALDLQLFVVPAAVDLADPRRVDAVLAQISALAGEVVLIVIDTMARCMGGDENDTRAMSDLVRECDRIRAATGAALIVVHHTAKGSKVSRGSSAFDGALDTLIRMERKGDTATVICVFQKDGDEFEPFTLRRQVVDLRRTASDKPATSCVLVPADVPSTDATFQDELERQEAEYCHAIRNLGTPEQATTTAVNEALGLARTSGHTILKRLETKGLAEVVGTARPHRLRLTPKGEKVATFHVPPRSNTFHGTSGSTFQRSPASKGRGTAEQNKTSKRATGWRRTDRQAEGGRG